MNRIRLGLAGVGELGAFHAQNLVRRVALADRVRVVDRSEEVARTVGNRLGVAWSTSYCAITAGESLDRPILSADPARDRCVRSNRQGGATPMPRTATRERTDFRPAPTAHLWRHRAQPHPGGAPSCGRLVHGEAVASGMAVESRIAAARGLPAGRDSGASSDPATGTPAGLRPGAARARARDGARPGDGDGEAVQKVRPSAPGRCDACCPHRGDRDRE
jgi:hypothetical protein